MNADITDRLAEFLAAGDCRQSMPGVTIRDAATMIMIDRTRPVATVLLGRRHHGHVFMPGKFVFPGGRVEIADRRVGTATALDPRVESRLMKKVRHPSPQKARGFALAAIREMFEETGLAVGKSGGAPTPPVAASLLARKDPGGSSDVVTGASAAASAATALPGLTGDAKHAPNEEWARYARSGVVPDLAAIHFVARAITPPGRPRRFDTRFFAVDADAIAARIEGVVGADTELVELVWLPIEHTTKLDMPGITMAVLEEIKLRTGAGFGHDLPVPFHRTQHGRRLRELL